jgi:cytochrome c-type biogenesis protein CcsB
MFMSSIIPETGMGRAGVLQSGWVVFHVSTLFLANVMFALACMAGVMYLLQERQIKRKSFGYLFSRLPPLQRLDKINYHCLLVGFPLMTIGLVTGFGYASLIWRKTWSGDPKEILSLVTWLIYAILVHERLTVGWRGRRSAWLSIVGFSAVLVTFLGVNLFLQGHHTAFTR